MRIGFTTSIPVEVLLAAGHTPIDLNNLFLERNPAGKVDQAEYAGFPRNTCAWIKGLYSTALAENLDAVIGVVEGDCSNTRSMMGMLTDKGMEVISFSYPHEHSRDALDAQIRTLETRFHVQRSQTETVRRELRRVRQKLVRLDAMTWKENRATGLENHVWQVESSDFDRDPSLFEQRLDILLEEAATRIPDTTKLRVAYLGVPPIFTNLYDFLEERSARVVFNEVQRQFAMPNRADDIVDQYLRYTYPYTLTERLEDILPQLEIRQIDVVVGYAQAFCHLQIDNVRLKRKIGVPFLSLEGDRPGEIDARTALRIESFLDIHQSAHRS